LHHTEKYQLAASEMSTGETAENFDQQQQQQQQQSG